MFPTVGYFQVFEVSLKKHTWEYLLSNISLFLKIFFQKYSLLDRRNFEEKNYMELLNLGKVQDFF